MTLTTTLACCGPAAGLLALASGRVRALARARPLAFAALVPAVWLLRAAEVQTLDLFAFAAVVTLALAVPAALRQVGNKEAGLTATDAIVWFALFVPLDYRWSYTLWPGKSDGAYTFWAAAIAYLATLGWGCERELPLFGHRAPSLRDVGVGVLALLGFSLISLPVGLGTGFVKPPSLHHFEARNAALELVGLVLTVALPEEIFFRSVLDSGLRARFSPVLSLLLSSLAFGLMHWPREHGWTRAIYIALATVAGVFYGWAHRAGKGLPAAVLCHTLVDWVWAEFLKG
jgi:membrane protease YdiL (CAAX protease family)